jgi:hypothetical protein
MQIKTAANNAGKPWSSREIVRQAQKLNQNAFQKLTERVVGRWIDPEAIKQGISRWKDSVMLHVAKGNALRGENSRVGVLVGFEHRYSDGELMY